MFIRQCTVFFLILAMLLTPLNPVATLSVSRAEAAQTAAPTATTWYVNYYAMGAGTGSSWTHAFTRLQTALEAAQPGDQIWVAQGVYTPTNTTDRTATFTLEAGVALYGGFDPLGGVDTWAERSWRTHPTVLSGDLDNNDITDLNGVVTSTASIVGNNAYHVLSSSGLTQTARLDGFYITGGKADGSDPNNRGGGMYNEASSPSLTNLAFTANRANNLGGGMYNENSSPSLANVIFTANRANNLGGGMYNHDSDPSLANAIFTANQALYDGGGMYNDGSSPSLANVSFAANQAGRRGGGVHNDNGSNPAISNSILWGNIGAQIYNNASLPTIQYSDVQSGCPAGSTCDHLVDIDPRFMRSPSPGSDAIWNGINDDYGDLHLQFTSPVLNAGSNAWLPADSLDLDNDGDVSEALPVDLGSAVRIHGGAVDMGAYEIFRLLYVDRDATGADTGSSWADAFTHLQSAAAQAQPGDQIWVAQGVYIPADTISRTATFTLTAGVAMYGGFDPTSGAEAWAERNWETYITVLSGDLEGNDITDLRGVVTSTVHIVGDNAYHVLTSRGIGAPAILDGFYVTAGKADGAYYPDYSGGGMLNYSNPWLVNIVFSANQAINGGGMANYYSTSPSLVNVTFYANQASSQGGGMYNDGGDPRLANTNFIANRANKGGGVYDQGSSPKLINVILIANQASSQGGGMYNYACDPELDNVTMTANQATEAGGAIYSYGNSIMIYHNILWGNSAPTGAQIQNEANAPFINHSVVEGGCPYYSNCDHVRVAEPLFRRSPSAGPDGAWGTSDDDYGNLRLQAASPAIDIGENMVLPTDLLDLDGDGNTSETLPFDRDMAARIYGPTIDAGAYEFRLLYVDQAATGTNNGSSWANAFTRLQFALEQPGSYIWVAQGIYLPTNTNDRTATFNLQAGLVLYGGFDPANGVDTWEERNWQSHPTVLSGDLDGNDITNADGILTNTLNIVGDNAYHVITSHYLDTNTRLDGFYVTGGKADGSSSQSTGGGMYNYQSNPGLVNIAFFANQASLAGGGMYNHQSNPSLVNVAFIANQTSGDGGGMHNYISSPSLVNVIFSANQAASTGGGMENYDHSNPSLVNTTFSANRANSGGAISNSGGSNSAIFNSILWGNQAPDGAQIYNQTGYTSTADIHYSVVQGGCSTNSTCEALIDSDPLFVRPPSAGPDSAWGTADDDYGNLRLQLTSPGIDAGNNTYLPADAFDLDGDSDTSERIPFDPAGISRFVDSVWIVDTGLPDPPGYPFVVDMGAYEALALFLYLPMVSP